MTIGKIEIYPYGRRRDLRTKEIQSDHVQSDSDIFDFTHKKYVELFDEKAHVEEIISDVLLKLIETTKSKDGFLALLEQQDDVTTFRYYCVYMDIGGVSFKSQVHDCKINVDHDSILLHPIRNKCIVISNHLKTDPRSVSYTNPDIKLPQDHPQINTFLGIPLTNGDGVIGQIGLSNAPKYKCKSVQKLVPLERFASNFIYLWKKRMLNVTKELEMKKEVISLKDSFIATMSHEIRTPLNGIVGMAKLLSESDNLSDKDYRYIRILAECSTQLMELVNDILDYSKMTTTGLVLNKHPFNLKNCITKAIEIIEPRALDKNLEIKLDIPKTLPENVTGDSRRLKQVLFNLLTNAVKFTEHGGIILSVSYEDVTFQDTFYNASKKFTFQIIDTGIGIKPHDQEKIFDIFTKINKDDHFYTNTTPGAGMGLAISKYIVETMNGEIYIKDSSDNGTTFVFTIILDDDTDVNKLLEIHAKDIKDKLAIVVDDNEDNRIFLMDALYSWGINGVSFSSAREALNYMSKKDFDIALVDLCKPGMSGLELTQAMRERGFRQPVIGLSSVGVDINGQEWFDHFTTKPVSKSQLFNLILRSFIDGVTNTKYSIDTSDDDSSGQELKIIVAEDDYYNQILIKELLINLGYDNVHIVSNGKMCVEEISINKYDICLMDIKMPVMDGLEATRRIKKMKNSPTVIAVSASVLDSDKNKCFAAGMDGYIAKPIQKEQLESVLKSLELRKN